MKKFLLMLIMAVTGLTASATVLPEKAPVDTLVVTTTPQMHCAGCEAKIKNGLRFVKGTKKIETSVEQQRVTIVYRADKAKAEDYIEALRKIGYEAVKVTR